MENYEKLKAFLLKNLKKLKFDSGGGGSFEYP
jgi:hypothetical protein